MPAFSSAALHRLSGLLFTYTAWYDRLDGSLAWTARACSEGHWFDLRGYELVTATDISTLKVEATVHRLVEEAVNRLAAPEAADPLHDRVRGQRGSDGC